MTLTDYLLTLECLVFCIILLRTTPRRGLEGTYLLFFASIGMAAWAGGTVHGFFPHAESLGHTLLWRLTMFALGATSLACWAAGCLIGFPRYRRQIIPIAFAGFAFYGAYVGTANRPFSIAILNYLPAILFLLLSLTFRRWRHRTPGATFGIAGVVITLAASGLQQGRIGLHPVYFDYNALYHALEAVALGLMFLCFRKIHE